MNTEPFGQHKERIHYTHHTHCCRTNFFQTALRNTFAGYNVNTQLSGRVRARRWTALAIQTDYSTPAAALGRRAHSHREALSLAAFLVDLRFCGATALTETMIRWTPINICMKNGSLHAYIKQRNHNDSSPLRLCRTFRRHSEGASARKAKGGTLYASRLLCL